MRSQWFSFVREVREKENRKRARKKNPMSHKEAMQKASGLWPKRKLQISKASAGVERKQVKEVQHE